MEQIKAWPEEEQKHFMNNAYLVKPGTYSGGSDTLRREQAVPRAWQSDLQTVLRCPLSS